MYRFVVLILVVSIFNIRRLCKKNKIARLIMINGQAFHTLFYLLMIDVYLIGIFIINNSL